jgi:hypothetical protein
VEDTNILAAEYQTQQHLNRSTALCVYRKSGKMKNTAAVSSQFIAVVAKRLGNNVE